MFRFTIRDVLWLTVVVALAVALVIQTTYTRHSVTRRANDEEKALLHSQYEVAKSEFHHRMAYWRGSHTGRMSLTDTCDAIERFVIAACDFLESPEERIEQCEIALHAAQFLEEMTKQKYEDEIEPLQALERVRYTKYKTELKLHLVRQQATER